MKGSIVEIWKGGRAYIVGGGPSVNDFDLELLRGKRVIVTNNAYKTVPWADFLYFMDCSWYNWHKESLPSFKGFKVTTCRECENEPGFIHLQYGAQNKIDMRPTHLSRGTNAGYGASCLAFKLGAREVVMATGFEMKMVGEQHNWHNEHKTTVHPKIYDAHIKSFMGIIPKVRAIGGTLVNCTPDSALEYVPYEPIEKWL